MGRFLSSDFLAKYEDIQPRNKGRLFEVVYLRTYSRWLPEKKRREKWNETIERVVEYSMSLYSGPAKPAELIEEAELMYDKLFHLEAYPAGRSYWIAGTKSVEIYPEANFNCCMLVVDRLQALGDLFHLLMLGCGVGFRILKEDVKYLPSFKTNFKVTHNNYIYNKYANEKDETMVSYGVGFETVRIDIGDSKKGWVEALRIFLEHLVNHSAVKNIELCYDKVRPAGERIKTFGGRAAGPAGLMDMFKDIEIIIKENGERLSPTGAMDLCNVIAKNVLVGGVRRSSQIALGSHDDDEFADAKMNLFIDPMKHNKKHRIMSNNSLVFNLKPSKEKLTEMFEKIRESWEPGFLNKEAADRRRPWFAAINPCGEALGADRGNCNLSGIVLTSFVKKKDDGKRWFDYAEANKAIRLATRIGLRQTNITWSLSDWDYVHKRDRLLGVSITGIMDALDALGWEFDSEIARDLFKSLRYWANEEADRYSFEMRVPRPLLVTILKPEGTISQLPTVSSGLHRSHAPYYIRRIRVSSLDPVCKALQHLGVPNEPDVNKPERIVFSFPISTGAKIRANDEPASRQLDRYLSLMKHYVDHNASCTLTVGDGEWEEIVDKVHDNWDDIVACAFANKDNSQYPQLPYETITKEQYDEMMVDFPCLDALADLVNAYEQDQAEEDELENECKGAACPIR